MPAGAAVMACWQSGLSKHLQQWIQVVLLRISSLHCVALKADNLSESVGVLPTITITSVRSCEVSPLRADISSSSLTSLKVSVDRALIRCATSDMSVTEVGSTCSCSFTRKTSR